MPKKLGRDLRPNDLLVVGEDPPARLQEVTWTPTGLRYSTTRNAVTQPLDPDRQYEVAHPMPSASMEWSTADQAWVVHLSTEGLSDEQARVLVNVDGAVIGGGV